MKATLEWPDLWTTLALHKDNGGRWYPSDTTPHIDGRGDSAINDALIAIAIATGADPLTIQVI